jgi:hypothetical protein
MPTPKIFIVVSSVPLFVIGGNQCRSGHPTVTHRIRLQLLTRFNRPKNRLNLSSSVDILTLAVYLCILRANEGQRMSCNIIDVLSVS